MPVCVHNSNTTTLGQIPLKRRKKERTEGRQEEERSSDKEREGKGEEIR